MISQTTAARTAGYLYLLMAISAPIGLIYVPTVLIVHGDATATADRLRASEALVRAGIASELFHQAVAIFLVLALYRLLKPVNEARARQMVILGALVSVPIVFVNVLNQIAALTLVTGPELLAAFDRGQLDALAYLFLELHTQGIKVAEIFWGLWLFPFGLLVIRSGFIPRVLGTLLIVAGVAYLLDASVSLLLPRYAEAVSMVAGLFMMGEFPIVVWLLVRGGRETPR